LELVGGVLRRLKTQRGADHVSVCDGLGGRPGLDVKPSASLHTTLRRGSRRASQARVCLSARTIEQRPSQCGQITSGSPAEKPSMAVVRGRPDAKPNRMTIFVTFFLFFCLPPRLCFYSHGTASHSAPVQKAAQLNLVPHSRFHHTAARNYLCVSTEVTPNSSQKQLFSPPCSLWS